MKKLVITALAVAGLALGAYAQGLLDVDNSASVGSICIGNASTFYSGTIGIEVWVDPSASTVPASLSTYGTLPTSGFDLEATYANQTITAANAGSISLGSTSLKDVTAAGNYAVAIAAWNNSAASYTAGTAIAGANAGLVAFVNPVVVAGAGPPPTPPALSGWTANLIMLPVTAVPEPTVLALAGLGAAALLIFRRRN